MKHIKTIIFIVINVLLIIGFFFFPILRVQISALQLNEYWTGFTGMTKVFTMAINNLDIVSQLLLEMTLPTSGFASVTSGTTGMIIIMAIFSIFLPLLSLGTIVWYVVKRDEDQLGLFTIIVSGYALVLSMSFYFWRKQIIVQLSSTLLQINQELTGYLTNLPVTETMVRTWITLGGGYYLMEFISILGIIAYFVIKLIPQIGIDYYSDRDESREDSGSLSKSLTGIQGGAHRMPPFISLVNGGKTMRISKIPCVIGRNRNVVDYYVYDESISRRHCMIDVYEGEVLIKDLNSLYGTRLNSIRIEAEHYVAIHHDDIIKLGETPFRLEIDWDELRRQMPDVAFAKNNNCAPEIKSQMPTERVVMNEGTNLDKVPTVVLYPGKNEEGFSQCVICKTPFFIGRSKRRVDYSINASSVSRKHCMIEYKDEEFYISDLGSANGTRINGVKLDSDVKQKLAFDDLIKLGDVSFYFRR